MTAAAATPAPTPGLPPGPRLPTAVQTLAWVLLPTRYMRWLHRRYGDAFTVRLPADGPVVGICDPAEIRRVFTGDPGVFHAGEAKRILEPLLGTRSVLLLDGREHLRQRRLMLPSFHGERIARYAPAIAEITEAEIASWPEGRPLALRPSMQAITFEVILRAVFGADEGPQRDELRTLLRRLVDGTPTLALLPWVRFDLGPRSPWGRFVRLRAAVDRAILALIAARRADPERGTRDDMLSLLLDARDEDGNPLSDSELRDELMTLLVAGHETTATALAWCFDLVLRHPAVHTRLVADADRGDTAYLDAVIKETLRLRPVVAVVARRLTEETVVAGHRLPAGALAAPNVYLTHLREDVYPDAEAFRPERFLERPTETYSWIPFGGGIRRCLGASFATLEMRIVVPTILRAVRLRSAGGRAETVVRRAVTFVPRHGTRVVVAGRRDGTAGTEELATPPARGGTAPWSGPRRAVRRRDRTPRGARR